MKKLVILIVAISVLISGCSLFVGCSVETTSDSNNVSGKVDTEEENVEHKEYPTEAGIIFVVTNNNSRDVKVEANVTYKNEGQIVASVDGCAYQVGANGGKSCFMARLEDENIVYDDYDIVYTVGDSMYDKESVYKDIEINATAGQNGELIVSCTNNSDRDDLYCEIGVLLKKNGEVVGYSYVDIMEINPSDTKTGTMETPYGIHYEDIDYDEYELFINETA